MTGGAPDHKDEAVGRPDRSRPASVPGELTGCACSWRGHAAVAGGGVADAVGEGGVQQLALEQQSGANEHRDDHVRVFAALGAVHGQSVGVEEFVRLGEGIEALLPSVKVTVSWVVSVSRWVMVPLAPLKTPSPRWGLLRIAARGRPGGRRRRRGRSAACCRPEG